MLLELPNAANEKPLFLGDRPTNISTLLPHQRLEAGLCVKEQGGLELVSTVRRRVSACVRNRCEKLSSVMVDPAGPLYERVPNKLLGKPLARALGHSPANLAVPGRVSAIVRATVLPSGMFSGYTATKAKTGRFCQSPTSAFLRDSNWGTGGGTTRKAARDHLALRVREVHRCA